MKSITYEFVAYAWCVGGSTHLDLRTGTTVESKPVMTAAEVYRHKAELPRCKEECYRFVKPMLAKGQWIFDPSLWQWSFRMLTPQCLACLVRMTFVNDGSETEKEFMSYIRKTGLLDKDFEIVKAYG